VTGEMTGGRALFLAVALAYAGAVEASPGNGIRLGGSSARLHPYLELETRYDSNIAYSDQGQRESGLVLHLRPGLILESPTDPAAVNFQADLDWAQYLGKNVDLSRLFGEAELGVGVNRRGSLGLELTDAFRRADSTSFMTFGGAIVENTNDLRVDVPWRPGGGAFVTTVSGGWQLETFEPFSRGRLCTANTPQCDQTLLSKLNYNDVNGGLELRWRFLPKTAVVVSGGYWKRLPADSALQSSASTVRAWGGLAGLFTNHVAGTVKAGYGSVSNAPGSVASWLANLEGEWIPTETTSVKTGYIHDVGIDPGANGEYTSHRAYLDGRALLSARYTTLLSLSYEHRSYGGASELRGADLLSAAPTAEAEVARWLRVGAGVAFTKRTSKLSGATPRLPGFSFDKTEAFVRVRGTY